jgi:hypothetical protein
MIDAPSNRTILWMHWHVLVRHRYSAAWMERYYRAALPVSMVMFAAAIAANTLAGIYATESASNHVTDIILSNIPVYDVDAAFVYGSILLIAFVIGLLTVYPRKIPYALSALALFYLIRAVFISLTHLGPYPEHATLNFESKIILLLWGGGDQFFSGHTGAPFMLALVFWRERWLRYIFLGSSFFFAAVVLLGHLHYSIDVMSAFFITYTIYQLVNSMFPREKALAEQSESTYTQNNTGLEGESDIQ